MIIELVRVNLRQTASGPLDEGLVRLAAVSLASFACDGSVGRQKGDPVFGRVTEGRQRDWATPDGARHSYSSCGDLPHFVVWLLAGAERYPEPLRSALRIVNRDEAWGWKQGWNIINLGKYAPVGSLHAYRHGEPFAALPGDVILIGENGGEHVQVFADGSAESQSMVSFDYGQFFKNAAGHSDHGGIMRTKHVATGVDGRPWALGSSSGRPFVWCLNTYAVLAAADEVAKLGPAYVPDGFVGGIPDDNPYATYEF